MNQPYTKEMYTPEITGPYFNGKEAAKYCGYFYDHFRHLASEYLIPRCGPRKRQYSRVVLDTFMNHPLHYKISASPNWKKLKKLEV